MTIKQKIDIDYLEAFKSGDKVKKNLLSVIKGEIQNIEKNSGITSLPDEFSEKILNRLLKSTKETISLLEIGSERFIQAELEKSIIESYLPEQISDEEIKFKISSLIESGITNIGQIMKEFATTPVDKSKVSIFVKEAISVLKS